MMFDFIEKMFQPADDGAGDINDEASPVAPLRALVARYSKAATQARAARSRQRRVKDQLATTSVEMRLNGPLGQFGGIDPLISAAFDESRKSISKQALAEADELVKAADAALVAELRAIQAEVEAAAQDTIARLNKLMESTDV
jgi:hypothetical protein